MHELKSVYIDRTGDWVRSGNNTGKFYLKSEADKVIAEKDAKIIQLEALIENYNRIAREIIDNANHQKHKRCLAMAEWCDAEADVADADGDYEDMQWYQKWHQRWLELAENSNQTQPPSRAKENDMEMIETKHDLLTTKYTKVLEEAEYKYNAPHTFKVIKAEEENSEEHKGENLVLSEIHFQEGPIKECGVNGVCNEDLLIMVVRRLEGFQNSEFKCRENALALTHIEEALLWLRKRTMGRENRGVEGTHKV